MYELLRFEVTTLPSGKYAVVDTENGNYVRFGFNSPPLYVKPGEEITEWNNWYSAREFAHKMHKLNMKETAQ